MVTAKAVLLALVVQSGAPPSPKPEPKAELPEVSASLERCLGIARVLDLEARSMRDALRDCREALDSPVPAPKEPDFGLGVAIVSGILIFVGGVAAGFALGRGLP